MSKALHSRASKVGQNPGMLVHIGEQKTKEVILELIDYDSNDYFQERQIDNVAELTALAETPSITWINVIGLHQVMLMERIGEAFAIHSLLMEDILNTDQRPKMEHSEQHVYLILKILKWDDSKECVVTEQLSIVLGRAFVLTFQEMKQDVFGPLRRRIREGKGRIRKARADYLAYAILDTVVDHYFLILEKLGDKIEAVEEELVTSPDYETLQVIYDLKREFLFLRRSVWPLRELLSGLQRGDSELFEQATLIYLRDVYEHIIQVIDTAETYRDVVASMLEIYLSSTSNKMNEVMKVLTVIATIFIPLTFITSLYGMNFHYMPELQWRWGYPIIWGVILLTGAAMLIFFKRKKWF